MRHSKKAVSEPWQPTPAQARALRRIRRAVHHAAKLGTYPPLVAYAVLDGQTSHRRTAGLTTVVDMEPVTVSYPVDVEHPPADFDG